MTDHQLYLGGQKSASGQYRLRDGTIGSERDALLEVLRFWEQRKADAELRIDATKKRLAELDVVR